MLDYHGFAELQTWRTLERYTDLSGVPGFCDVLLQQLESQQDNPNLGAFSDVFKMHMGYILFQCATTAHMSELSIIPLSLSEVKQRLVVCL